MKPITIVVDDVKLTLKSLEQNKTYKCDCFGHSFGCSLKQQLSNIPSEPSFIATEVTINVRNTSTKEWDVDIRYWELIDTDGYAYEARALCDVLRSAKTIGASSSNRSLGRVTQGTQSDFVLVFPEIESDKKIASISYSDRSTSCSFAICEMNPNASDLLQARKAMQEVGFDSKSRMLDSFVETQFGKLEEAIFDRLNKTLSRSDALKLEKRIEKLSSFIKERLEREYNKKTKTAFEGRFNSIIESYNVKLEGVKKSEEERKNLEQQIGRLHELTPRQFEEYVADIFEHLGFEKVTLTPSTNDKGIDIFAEEKGSKIAIQCKRYKGKVDAPEIRDFLGAMQHAEVQKGYFVTTGIFSIGAQNMAAEHCIELIDINELKNRIQKATIKKQN